MTLEQFDKIRLDIEKLEKKITLTARRIEDIKEYGTLTIKIDREKIEEEFKSKWLAELFVKKIKEYKSDYENKIKSINDIGLKISSKFDDRFWNNIFKEF